MKRGIVRNTAIVAAGCLVVLVGVGKARTEASGQDIQRPASKSSVTINGETHRVPDNQPFSISSESADGNTHINVSIHNTSTGDSNSSQQTHIEVHTDTMADTQTTQSEQYTDE